MYVICLVNFAEKINLSKKSEIKMDNQKKITIAHT